jgi:pimeloyl-ACP methyl ester carboxylesterase
MRYTPEWMHALRLALAEDAEWGRRHRGLTARLCLEFGPARYLVEFHDGRLVRVQTGVGFTQAWDFAIRAREEAWDALLAPVPAPGKQSLFALMKAGDAVLEGNMRLLMQHVWAVVRLVEVMRGLGTAPQAVSGAAPEVAAPPPGDGPRGHIEPIVGRYVHLGAGGIDYRIYFEEAGAGIPLVCLHTAGSDGRQYRDLMNDSAITDRYRVIAFDMPWHGKSLPPDRFWETKYQLTTDHYIAVIEAFCAALGLARPVLMGCSMGGKIMLEAAARCTAGARAVIGLEAADDQGHWFDLAWLDHPQMHGAEVGASLVQALCAPQSPESRRREIWWQYVQGGPGIFPGDLHFYRVDKGFPERVKTIDTNRCAVYLLTGEYDFSCRPEDTIRTGARIPGAEVTIMRELGHFPNCEHPERFREYLLPVLERIRTAG